MKKTLNNISMYISVDDYRQHTDSRTRQLHINQPLCWIVMKLNRLTPSAIRIGALGIVRGIGCSAGYYLPGSLARKALA